MNGRKPLRGEELERLRRGLSMTAPPDPARLAREAAALRDLEAAGPLRRTLGFLRFVGPGYLQSAMTLGGGTAAFAVFAGAAFGYRLLWVAPLSMSIGLVMLSAVSWQTLSTGMRPFEAMRRYAGAPFAWAWAGGALVASIIWHFPQYALAADVLADMGDLAGFGRLPPAGLAFLVLAWAVAISMLYGRSPGAVRLYERVLKYMVWGIVVCFGLVVLRTGVHDVGALLRGFLAFEIPEGSGEISALELVVAGLSAAVGVNMLFLYPYSLLARGWGRDHRRLARFDLGVGTFLPYVLAASLITIASAETLHPWTEKGLTPLQAASGLAETVGPVAGRLIFNLGVLGMALSSITLHMICCGFVAVELFGVEVGSRRYRLATLLPTPGVLGPLLWKKLFWLPVPATILCGLLLPVAYLGFLKLQRSRAYLGADRPGGLRGRIWWWAMAGTILLLSAFLAVWVWLRFGARG